MSRLFNALFEESCCLLPVLLPHPVSEWFQVGQPWRIFQDYQALPSPPLFVYCLFVFLFEEFFFLFLLFLFMLIELFSFLFFSLFLFHVCYLFVVFSLFIIFIIIVFIYLSIH